MSDDPKLKLFLILSLIGLCAYCLYKIGLLVFQHLRIKASGTLVQATIIGYETFEDSEGVSYHPIMRYETIEGVQIISVSEEGSLDNSKSGQLTWIFYDSSDPSKFISQKTNFWIFISFGFIMFGTAFVLLIRELLKSFD